MSAEVKTIFCIGERYVGLSTMAIITYGCRNLKTIVFDLDNETK